MQDGDMITLDAEKRVMDVHISDEEMAARRAAWTPQPPKALAGVPCSCSCWIKRGGRKDAGSASVLK